MKSAMPTTLFVLTKVSLLFIIFASFLLSSDCTPIPTYQNLDCSAQSRTRVEELLLEDQNVKRRREHYQKQSSLLAKVTQQLSVHDNRAAAVSSYSDTDGAGIWQIL